MKPKDDTSKVVDMELFNDLVRASFDLMQRHEVLRKAARCQGGSLPKMRVVRRIQFVKSEIDVAIEAMQSGRDPYKQGEEILSCFRKGGRHRLGTIARRYFGVKYTSYAQERWLDRRLRLLIGADYVNEGHRPDTFVLVTPEMREERAKKKIEQAAWEERRRAERARIATVRAALKAFGVKSRKSKYESMALTMGVAEVEKLIALVSAKECA